LVVIEFDRELHKFLTKKKYDIIMADPPWSYNDQALAGNRGASQKYEVLPIHTVKNMPVGKLAKDNSFLFLWTTFPMIDEALQVMKAWGFEYKTVAFTWVKKNKNGTNFMGMGSYTRANAEICLLGKRGKPKVISHSVKQIIESIPEKHSKKPDEVRNKIVELCGDLKKIELFARYQVPKWDCFGNEL
jgi:site-specific DNA-methyltransferase (adenine-specific)